MQEVYEPSGKLSGISSRVVGIEPINPNNGPDKWEQVALMSFISGKSEVSSLDMIDGKSHMRLMRPLLTEQSCMGCHEEQGRKIGSIRGGISVSVPMSLVWPMQKAEMIRRVVGYGTVWFLGMLGITLGVGTLRRHIQRRHKIEEALRESRFRIRQIAANIPGVVYQFLWHPADRTYSFPFVSRGVKRMLGFTPEDVYRDPVGFFPGMLFEEEIEPLLDSIVEAAENETTWRREMRCRTVDGETKWIRVSSRPYRLPDGDVLFNGVFLDVTDLKSAESRLQEAHDILEDRVIQRTIELQESNRELQKEISERKRAEQWLLKSEEQLRSFFELGVVGMAVTSPDRYWEEVNPQLCRMLGYSEHELTRKTWDELTHPDDLGAEEANFERMLSGVLKEYTVDKRFVRKDGQPLYAVITARCVYDSKGEVENLVMLVRDAGKSA
jgi:PAS domain S-box-containing protein